MKRSRASTSAVLLVLGAFVAGIGVTAVDGAPASGASAGAFVRVNQVGYPSTDTKRAYLLASAPETGATFAVRNGTTDVFGAPIGADQGRWSPTFPHVYVLDFDGVTAPGVYTIEVTGSQTAVSPPFRVDAAPAVDAGVVANALAFYRNERDGVASRGSPLPTKAGHLNDRSAMTYATPRYDADSGEYRGRLRALGTRIDAAGGWWDAGDYLKFVETTSYTDAILLSGIRDFPEQMGAGSGSDFTRVARFGTNWLLRMWNDRTRTLYYQVGIGEGNDTTAGDHDIWRLPQADDRYHPHDPTFRFIRHRPVFRAGPPGSPISPNLAGRDAAAFAECFQVFAGSDRELATRCLRAAEHIFDLADTHPRGHVLTVIPFSFYPEQEWRDDLEWGATELALALDAGELPRGLPHSSPRYYLRRAARWAAAYIAGPNDGADPLNLYDVAGIAHPDLIRAIARAGHPAGLAVSRAELLADMRRVLDAARRLGMADPFGFGSPWNEWDTTSHGAGLSVMASEYDELSGTSRYAVNADRWLGNILGANAWGLSLIVGDGSVFPRCLQHQVANIEGSLDGTGAVLAGAAVEGPNAEPVGGFVDGMRRCPMHGVDRFAPFNGSGAQFRDNVQSYDNTEPAIDLTATSPLAFARQAAGVR
ncbi:MAG TPA: glycoside hydrolase family 9 protein [Actinomycetota bacterium]|nr:glycoside hydrolase family 9 protein [Actinomycetota bacterium]